MLFLLCAIPVACNKNDLQREQEPQGKEPIVLSVGGVDFPAAETKAVETAVITDGTNKTLSTFGNTACVFFVMKSEYDTTNPDYGGSRTTKYTACRGDVASGKVDVTFDSFNQKYWNDAHSRSSVLSLWAYAQQGRPSWKDCTFEKPNTPAQDESEYVEFTYHTTSTTYPWYDHHGTKGTIYPCIMTWKASHHTGHEQTAESVMVQDLLFSNNLTYNKEKSWPDNRLKYDFATRHFPAKGDAKMIFYHAMSKITIKIKEGAGFNKSATTDFQFTSGNIKLSGFNVEGTFNIKDGEFQQVKKPVYDIPSIALQTPTPTAEVYYTLEALAIPNINDFMTGYGESDTDSRFLSESSAVMMQFTIDNNLYKITADDLYKSLVDESGDPVANATKKTDAGTYIPLEAGKNYVFTFTVSKSPIVNITAQVAGWETVTAEEQTPSNARIKLQLEERGYQVNSNAKFYKANDNKTSGDIDDNYAVYNWKTGYGDIAATWDTNHWKTSLYWESNRDFYHFRALSPSTAAVTTDSDGGDFTTLTSAVSYTDVCWGAPMLDDGNNETTGSFKWKYGPTKNGFDADDNGNVSAGLPGGTKHQIYKAIGPTTDPVKLVLFHMMSDLNIDVKTSNDPDKVELCHEYVENEVTKYKRTRVDLVGFKNGGKVLLGSGLVNATGDASTKVSPVNIPYHANDPETHDQYETQNYVFGAVPQDLTNVQLYITTPDDNQYIVDLANAKATTISTTNIENPYKENGGKYIIDRWYPGFKYNYSFTLRKSGILDLTATVVAWETVEVDDEPVVIR